MSAATLPFSLHRCSAAEQVQAIEDGLPVDAMDRLAEALNVSAAVLRTHLRISDRTLSRRRLAGRLSTEESERLLRYTNLYERAAAVLESHEAARRWLQSPRPALGGLTPLEFAQTEPGAREVESLLGRIEHGIFS